MAFNQYTLTKSVNQARDIFDEYIYKTTDTKAEAQAIGYFGESRFVDDPDWIGSLITASCIDGFITGHIDSANTMVQPLYPFNPTTDTVIQRVLTASSAATTQNPTGLGPSNAIQIEFGTGQGSIIDPVMITTAGEITLNETGFYRAKVTLVFGRDSNPGASELLFRVRANGVQSGISVPQKISSADVLTVYELDAWVSAPGGTVFAFDVMRDSSGNDSGGLLAGTVTAEAGSWNAAPCATILIDRPTNP
jgi:hypothetical protein